MKKIPILLAISCILWSCKTSLNRSPEHVNEKIRTYIQKNCKTMNPCIINIKDVTDFSWDKFYVFDMAVESDVITKVIGKEYNSTSQYYSRKWFFLKDGQITHFEQRLTPEVDNPVSNGDVEIDLSEFREKYGVFNQDSVFEVKKLKVEDGEFYRIHCINRSKD